MRMQLWRCGRKSQVIVGGMDDGRCRWCMAQRYTNDTTIKQSDGKMTMAGEGVKRAVRAGGIAKKFIRKIIRLNKIVGGGREPW